MRWPLVTRWRTDEEIRLLRLERMVLLDALREANAEIRRLRLALAVVRDRKGAPR